MAAARASGAALGMSSRPDGFSPKIGRTSSAQPGQIAGADAPRLAERMPATKVPCWQGAAARAHARASAGRNLADVLLGEVRMIEQDRAVDEADGHVGPAIAASH